MAGAAWIALVGLVRSLHGRHASGVLAAAVSTRRHLKDGVLDRTRQALASADTAIVDGFTFRVLHRRTRPIPPRTAGWEMIVELE